MNTDVRPDLAVRVDPAEMVQYVHALMTSPYGEPGSDKSFRLAQRQWGGDTPVARAAQLRWSALNRAFGDARPSPQIDTTTRSKQTETNRRVFDMILVRAEAGSGVLPHKF